MTLKYKTYHQTCSDCQLKSTAPASNIIAFRFVRDGVPTKEDFFPPAIEQPTRGFPSGRLRCSAYALSFFTSLANARAAHKKIAKQSKMFAKKKSCVAETLLDSNLGKAGPVDRKGHFDLHEYKGVEIEHSVQQCHPA